MCTDSRPRSTQSAEVSEFDFAAGLAATAAFSGGAFFSLASLYCRKSTGSGTDGGVMLLDEQAVDEVPHGGVGGCRPAAAGRGEPQRLLDDVAERGTVIDALEGCGPVQQLVDEDAEHPLVHRGPHDG
jgi:hypothetical protein